MEINLDGHDELTAAIIGAAIDVHRALGPGLLESAYEQCLVIALQASGLSVQRQVECPIQFMGHCIQPGYRIDLIVEGQVIVEIKAVEKLLPVHEAQVLTYLKLSKIRVGLLLNFHTPVLKDGIKRLAL